MAKYTRFDPNNKKKSRDKSSREDRLKSNNLKKSRQVDIFEDDWEELNSKFNIENIIKNLE